MTAIPIQARVAQIGLEATPGTLVPATTRLLGTFAVEEEQVRSRDTHPRLAFLPDDGPGIITRKGGRIAHDTELTFEEALYAFLCGLENDAVPTGAGPYTWQFFRNWGAVANVKSATWEYAVNFGSETYEREFGFAHPEEIRIGIDATSEDPATFGATWFGRALQTSTVTAALAPVTGRQKIAGMSFGLWIDSSWATLGNTAKTGLLKSAQVTIPTGLAPDMTVDARADLDFSGVKNKLATPSIALTFNHDTNGKTEVDAWRDGTARAVRLEATVGTKVFTIDAFGYYQGTPQPGEDDEQDVVTLTLEIDRDGVSGEGLDVSIVNDLATQGAL